MARQRSYGELLRDARERKHMDLSSVSQRLRIRPDILRAIEEADFARMPPRGYTRNMISAYARLVGLNPSEVTTMYLDEAHMHETGRARVDERRAERMEGAGASRRSRGGESARDRSARTTREGRGERNVRGSSGASAGRSLRENRASEGRARSVGRGEPRQGYVGGSSYPSLYSAAQNNRGAAPSKLPFFIGGAVILVVLIVVLVVVFGGSKQAEEEVPNVPISGLTDTSSPENEPAVTQVESEPTSAKFTYTVADGGASWIEIYLNGASAPEEAGTISGPTTKDFTVTGTLTFKTANSGPVTCEVDGEKVELVADGSYATYTVDFAKILEQWREEHGAGSSSDSSAAASGASSSSASGSAS